MALSPEQEQQITNLLSKFGAKNISILQDALKILDPDGQLQAQSQQAPDEQQAETEAPVEDLPQATVPDATQSQQAETPAEDSTQSTAPEASQSDTPPAEQPTSKAAPVETQQAAAQDATTIGKTPDYSNPNANSGNNTVSSGSKHSSTDVKNIDSSAPSETTFKSNTPTALRKSASSDGGLDALSDGEEAEQRSPAPETKVSKREQTKGQRRKLPKTFVASDGGGESTVSDKGKYTDVLTYDGNAQAPSADPKQANDKPKELPTNFIASDPNNQDARTIAKPGERGEGTIVSDYRYKPGYNKAHNFSGKDEIIAQDSTKGSNYVSDEDNRIVREFNKALDKQAQKDSDKSYKELEKTLGTNNPGVLKKLSNAIKAGGGKVKDFFKGLKNRWDQNRILKNVDSDKVSADDLEKAFTAAKTNKHKFGDSKEIDGAVIEFQAALARNDYALLESTMQLVKELKEYQLLEKDQSYAFLKNYFSQINEDYQGLVDTNKYKK